MSSVNGFLVVVPAKSHNYEYPLREGIITKLRNERQTDFFIGKLLDLTKKNFTRFVQNILYERKTILFCFKLLICGRRRKNFGRSWMQITRRINEYKFN